MFRPFQKSLERAVEYILRGTMRQTAGRAIYHEIKKTIVSGELRPGEKLVELELAERFGVSRTPVREALRMLERERLVSSHPYRGFVVTRLSYEEVMMLYEARASLEPLVVSLAAKRIGPEEREEIEDCLRKSEAALRERDLYLLGSMNHRFHGILSKASGNFYLEEMLSNLWHLIDIMRVSYFLAFPERMAEAVAEHRAIYDAVRSGDATAAAERALVHIENTHRLVPNIYRDSL